MKKKILAVAIAAIMLVTAIASMSLAYLTDTDDAVNVMEMGKVDIVQLEYERLLQDEDKDGIFEWVSTGETDKYGYTPDEIQPFTQDKPLYPVVCLKSLNVADEDVMMWDDRVSGHQQSWAGVAGTKVTGAPGSNQLFDETCKNVVDKFVFVENAGKSDAYVRTIFAFEQGSLTDEEFETYIGLNRDKNPNEANGKGHWQWENIGSVTIGNSTYYVKCATYLGAGSKHGTVEEGVLAPNTISYPSLLQVYLSRMAKNDTVEALDGNKNGKYDILVLSQATQTNGFVNSTNGYENATLALDTAFGDVTKATAANWLVQVLPQN